VSPGDGGRLFIFGAFLARSVTLEEVRMWEGEPRPDLVAENGLNDKRTAAEETALAKTNSWTTRNQSGSFPQNQRNGLAIRRHFHWSCPRG